MEARRMLLGDKRRKDRISPNQNNPIKDMENNNNLLIFTKNRNIWYKEKFNIKVNLPSQTSE
jgi:hypothetical protein